MKQLVTTYDGAPFNFQMVFNGKFYIIFNNSLTCDIPGYLYILYIYNIVISFQFIYHSLFYCRISEVLFEAFISANVRSYGGYEGE